MEQMHNDARKRLDRSIWICREDERLLGQMMPSSVAVYRIRLQTLVELELKRHIPGQQPVPQGQHL